jgi:ornithine carbamoyltransferase
MEKRGIGMKITVTAKQLSHFKGKDFLTLSEWMPEDVSAVLELAVQVKSNKTCWKDRAPLKGKSVAMIFDKPSTRTRVSFEVGIAQLGGHALILERDSLQVGRGETVEDTGQVLSQYVDAIIIRTYRQQMVEQLAASASVPVINALTDLYHPCQALADAQTLYEHKGKLAGLKLAYVGDGNNVLHSLMHVAALTGMHLSVSTPKGYEPLGAVWEEAQALVARTGGSLQFSYDPFVAVQGADAVYTDVWASMGQEEEKETRKKAFASYQVNEELMAVAKEDAIFLHCLPAYRGLEVTAEVLDGPQSVVFKQAENRLHAQKALLIALLGEE